MPATTPAAMIRPTITSNHVLPRLLRSLSSQHFLYFLPLPHEHVSLRPGWLAMCRILAPLPPAGQAPPPPHGTFPAMSSGTEDLCHATSLERKRRTPVRPHQGQREEGGPQRQAGETDCRRHRQQAAQVRGPHQGSAVAQVEQLACSQIRQPVALALIG